MKTYLGSIAAAVAALMLAAVSPVNARGGGGGGGSHGAGGFGGWHGSGGLGPNDWGHHHGHDHGDFFYFWGGPFWYPYYWPPYYYYDYYDYYDNPPPYYHNNNAATYDSGDYPRPYPQYDGRNYLMLGHDSGKALRLRTVSQDWLIEYVRAYIVNASPSARDDFHRGFVSGYGEGAEAVLKKATEEAGRVKPQPEATPPASRTDEPATR